MGGSQEIAATADQAQLARLQAKLSRLRRSVWMCDYCTKARELAKRLTEWTMSEVCGITAMSPNPSKPRHKFVCEGVHCL